MSDSNHIRGVRYREYTRRLSDGSEYPFFGSLGNKSVQPNYSSEAAKYPFGGGPVAEFILKMTPAFALVMAGMVATSPFIEHNQFTEAVNSPAVQAQNYKDLSNQIKDCVVLPTSPVKLSELQQKSLGEIFRDNKGATNIKLSCRIGNDSVAERLSVSGTSNDQIIKIQGEYGRSFINQDAKVNFNPLAPS